ncbi:hypothetical protein GALMADRAFT_137170 [Galerina marginata CBS 339.88]|uniref:Uncharacterized protein n=1 Tax=Galerina marginata (strain CBS 339.88) TaxID=685588 RepID=A0A067TAB9_GALM3|nr:hypothetical protein GALMADRAFT_137170 [Galerina marginata CBS 339.88]
MESSSNPENARAKPVRGTKAATKIQKKRKNHRKLDHISNQFFDNTIGRCKVVKNSTTDAHPSPSVDEQIRLPDNGTQNVEVHPDDDIEAPYDDMDMLSVPARMARANSFNSTTSSEFSSIYSSTSSNESYSPPLYPSTPHNLAMWRERNGPTPGYTQDPIFGNIQAIPQPYYSTPGGPVQGGQPILGYTAPQGLSISQGPFQNYGRPHLPEQHHGASVLCADPTHAPFDSTPGLPYNFPSGYYETEFVPEESTQSAQYHDGMLILNSGQNPNARSIHSQNMFLSPVMQPPYYQTVTGSWPAEILYTQASQPSEENGPAT